MPLTYGELKEKSTAVAADLAAARSARNLLSRRKADEEKDERQAESARRRRARRDERELKELLRRKVRVRVPEDDRPRIGRTTARNLYHRAAGMLLGATGLTDARGPDGLYSIHFAFTPRGFASTKGRRWRRGEAERAARYIVREEGLERGELGWWSNVAADRNELVAFYRTVEALERHDRSNANVYISEVIALPAELTARQRRRAVRRICRFFQKRGLPYTVAIHTPDPTGDRRNYHCHIIYSLRPCERTAAYEWSFGVSKEADINTPDGILGRRIAVVKVINATLAAAGIAKRYTHLSNKARRMAAAQPKLGQQRTWAARRLEALEASAAQLQRLDTSLRGLIGQLSHFGSRLQQARLLAHGRLEALAHRTEHSAARSSRVDRCWTRAGVRLAVQRDTITEISEAAERRLGKTLLSSNDALNDLSSRLGRESVSRMRRAAAMVVERLSEARRVTEGGHAVPDAWFHRARGKAEARLEGNSSRVHLLSAGAAQRLATISARVSKHQALHAHGAALRAAQSRLDIRLSGTRRSTLTRLARLGDVVTDRSEQNKRMRVHLAGVGAVAKLREERLHRRDERETIARRLHGHKALLGHARTTTANLSATLGKAVADRLQDVRERLQIAGRSPRLQRAQRLETREAAVPLAIGSPARLHDIRDGALVRLVGTANEIGWAMRGAGAVLTNVRSVAERGHRLSILTDRISIIQSVSSKRASVRLLGNAATTAIDARHVAVTKRLTDQRLSLEQLGAKVQQLSQVEAERVKAEAKKTLGAYSKSVAEPENAHVPGPTRESPSGSSNGSLRRKRPGSATESLRSIVPTRTPETDLHGSVLPQVHRGPMPSEQRSMIGRMWGRLRGEAVARQADVQAKVCERALLRLTRSQATITKGPDGAYTADDRGLLPEEQKVLASLAHSGLVQAALAGLWEAQEARNQAAAAAAAAAPSSAPTTSPRQQGVTSAGVELDVQSQFLAGRSGRGK